MSSHLSFPINLVIANLFVDIEYIIGVVRILQTQKRLTYNSQYENMNAIASPKVLYLGNAIPMALYLLKL